jgi:hypothetical protein
MKTLADVIDQDFRSLKIRVPEDAMPFDKGKNEGYLVYVMGDLFLSPAAPGEDKRPLYLIDMTECNPNEFEVIE